MSRSRTGPVHIPRSSTYPREKLMALRRAEMGEAAAHLKIRPTRITHLGLPDTAAPKGGAAFDAADADSQVS